MSVVIAVYVSAAHLGRRASVLSVGLHRGQSEQNLSKPEQTFLVQVKRPVVDYKKNQETINRTMQKRTEFYRKVSSNLSSFRPFLDIKSKKVLLFM